MEECGMTTSKQIDSWKSILTMAIDTMEEEKYQLGEKKYIKNVD